MLSSGLTRGLTQSFFSAGAERKRTARRNVRVTTFGKVSTELNAGLQDSSPPAGSPPRRRQIQRNEPAKHHRLQRDPVIIEGMIGIHELGGEMFRVRLV